MAPESATINEDEIKARIVFHQTLIQTSITDFLGCVASPLGDI